MITKQFLKYACVATLGMGLHFAILTSLTELTGLYYWASFLAALPFTYTVKFLLDKYWTFKLQCPTIERPVLITEQHPAPLS